MPTNKPKLSHRNIQQKNIIAALFFFSCYGLAQAEDFSNIGSSNTKIIEFNDAELHTYDNIHIEHSPKITNSQFSISLKGGQILRSMKTLRLGLTLQNSMTVVFNKVTTLLPRIKVLRSISMAM